MAVGFPLYSVLGGHPPPGGGCGIRAPGKKTQRLQSEVTGRDSR